jgi:hypothetical protein
MHSPERQRDWHQDFGRYPVVEVLLPRHRQALEDLYHNLRRFGMALELNPPYPHERDIWTVDLEYAGIVRRMAVSHHLLDLRDERASDHFLETIAHEAQHVFMSAVMMAPQPGRVTGHIDMDRPRFFDDRDRRPLFREPNRRRDRPGVSVRFDEVTSPVGGAALQHAASMKVTLNANKGPTREQLEADYRV